MHATTSPTDLHSTPVQFVKGVGPKKAAALEKYGIRTLEDLLFHIPRRYLDRTAIVTIAQLRREAIQREVVPASPGGFPEAAVRREFTVLGEVRSFRVVGIGARARFTLILADQTASLQCVWFGGVQYWKRMFQVGETLALSGQPSLYGNILQFVHPDIDRIAPPGGQGEDAEIDTKYWVHALHTGGLVPLYPSGQELARVGLDSGGFRRVISHAMKTYGGLIPELLPGELVVRRALIPGRTALETVHFPRKQEELPPALKRLKYEELFLFQLKLAMKRRWTKTEGGGISFSVRSTLARRLVDSLPFSLTRAQVRVIQEISSDMQSGAAMNRLLQGDVGSGKTVVALVAMLIAVDNGYQAVFMAPTELLAEQHFATLRNLLGDIPVNIRLLVGAQKSALRRDVLEDINSGRAQIIVGTHALFEKEVVFSNLGFVIIDEQHRFGVLQRASLREKGTNPDVLVMTATPIPRTLSLTLYGDLDVSVIDELPKGRKPIRTVTRSETEMQEVADFVREQVRGGRQVYFVYPLIEESEKLDLKAATVHWEHLQNDLFPDLRVGMIHGRLPREERDAVMGQFKRRELDILVATTVIEVGIDIPNASVMVIENAERFGLAQLHQLRGRVGRGSEQSWCILVTKPWIAKKTVHRRLPKDDQLSLDQQRLAEQRLAAMVSMNDGFAIAEVDLRLRGPGDFFGTRQSGVPEFKIADILSDTPLLNDARADAFSLVESDPRLQEADHRVLLVHLRSRYRDEMALMNVG